MVSFLGERSGQARGELFPLDRKLVGSVNYQKEDSISSLLGTDSPQSPLTFIHQQYQKPRFGGQVVLHASQGLLFTVESFHPRALSEPLPFGEFSDGE